jgi:hypothetical protein
MKRFTLLLAALTATGPCATAETPPPPWVDGSTTLAVLPDTEVYSQKRPELLEAQARWIAGNGGPRRIAYALSLGDIVHDDVAPQWEVAQRCYRILDGKVPYALALGNHDYSGDRRATRVNEFFPVAGFTNWPTFGGVFESSRIENSFHLCRIGSHDWILLALEFGPRDVVVAWANRVLAAHPDRLALLVTHAYLFRGDVRFDHTAGARQRASPHGWGNDGEQLWQKLVRKHANLMLVLSGHVASGGPSYLASEGDHGNTVHQLMADFESLRGGGSGYLRLLEFHPDGTTVQVRTYSPVLDRHLTDPGHQFAFKLRTAKEGSR